MNESDIRQALRREMPASEPPPFDASWRAAERRYRAAGVRYRTLVGLAATLAAIAIIVNALIPEQTIGIEMPELLETTSWQAPSDVLMPERQFDIYQELPALMESTEEAGGALL